MSTVKQERVRTAEDLTLSEQGVCPGRNALPCALWRSERGISAIEYSLMASLIALAIIFGVRTFGEQLGKAYENIGKEVVKIIGP